MQILFRLTEFAVFNVTTPADLFGNKARAVFPRLAILAERRRQIRHLAQLEDRLLDDIGLTRCDVAREYARPFWRV